MNAAARFARLASTGETQLWLEPLAINSPQAPFSMHRSTRLGLMLLAALMAGAALWHRGVFGPGSNLPEPAPPGSITASLVSGRVLSAGKPVAGALVRVQGLPESTLTDDAGRFQLVRPRQTAGELMLTSSKAGRRCARARAGAPGIDVDG